MALTKENIVQLLKEIDLFSEFKDKTLQLFAKNMNRVFLHKGDILFSKGDIDNSLYIISEGCVEIHDKNYVFTTLTSKQYFGEYTLIDSACRSATVTAVHNTELYELSKETFEAVTNKNPELWRNTLVAMVKRLRDYNILEEKLTSRTIDVQKKKYHIEKEKDFIDQQKKNLEAINNSKDKFLTIIAHELKSPLFSINALSEDIISQYDNIDKEKCLNQIEQIKKYSTNASNLLENLLQWARSQAGSLKINFKRTNINDIIVEVIELYEAICQSRNITIVNNIGNEHFGYIDSDMINTVLRNLISNAIQYSYDNSKIELNIEEVADMLNISIQDYGIGIEKTVKDTLFSIDQRPETNNKEESSGIGLVLCKEFVLKNGGSIWLESTPGKGTTFSFSIPRAL